MSQGDEIQHGEETPHGDLMPQGNETHRDLELDARLRATILGEALDATSVDARIREQLVLEIRRQRIRRGKWIAAAGIAAVLLVAVCGYLFLPNRGSAAMCADAARDHRAEVVEHSQRRWLTETVSIDSLASKQGFSARSTQELAPPGYRVARGKLCRLGGRVFLHLVYTDGTHEYSFYLRDSAAEDLAPTIDLASEHVAPVPNRRFTALIVTDESHSRAADIARFAASRL